MFTRFILGFVACLTMVSWPVSMGASESETVDVIRAIFTSTSASETECTRTVRDETGVRFMGVLCASFDGSFEEFRQRLNISRDDVVALTDWEHSGALREKIYALDETVIGVRFEDGVVLVVYTRGPQA